VISEIYLATDLISSQAVRERLEKLGVRPEDIYLKVANKTEALAEIEQRYSLDIRLLQ